MNWTGQTLRQIFQRKVCPDRLLEREALVNVSLIREAAFEAQADGKQAGD